MSDGGSVMDDIQTQIAELEQLLGGAEWNADLADQAEKLLETIQNQRGESDPQVVAWDQAFQRRNAALQGGFAPLPEDGSSASLPVLAADTTTLPIAPVDSSVAAVPASTETTAEPGEDLLAEPGAFGLALRAVVALGRFRLRKKLQSGQFSTGYEAIELATGRRAVVKLPAQEAWDSRFEECAQALMGEAALLQAIAPIIADAPPGECAQPVAPIASGQVSVAGWPHPVPWVAQAFARGQRVSERIPMRGGTEADALRLLAQVTGMVRRLYQHHLAHRDLKQDCLFWHTADRQVEVIDWNRATRNPSQVDQEREFGTLQRLVSAVLLGPLFQWSGPNTYARDLLLAFQGTPLSRGARLLLLRLLDPNHPQPIRHVDELDAALREVLVFWDVPLRERPEFDASTPQSLSLLLSHLAVESQRGADSPVAADCIEWLADAQRAAQAEIHRRIAGWRANPDSLRAAQRRIEEPWLWLPDLWPLNWLVPLSRLWVKHLPREQDLKLSELADAMSAQQWDRIATLAQQLQASAPAPLAATLQEIYKVALAYRSLDQIEQLLRTAQPDHATALHRLIPLRAALPLEPRMALLARQVDAGIELTGRMARLREQIADLGSRAPDRHSQRELLRLFDDLRVLGLNDQRYAEQQQKVAQIDAAEQALRQAQSDHLAAQRLLAPWLEHAELAVSAPDLAHEIGDLAAELARREAQAQVDRLFTQLRLALEAGHLGAAADLLRQVRLIATNLGDQVSAVARGEIERLEAALPQITALWQALEHGKLAGVAALNTTRQPAVALPLAFALNELVDLLQKLTRASDLPAAMEVYEQIATRPTGTGASLAVTPLWDRLHSLAVARLTQAIRAVLEGPEAIIDEQIRQCEQALDLLRSDYGKHAALGALQRALEQYRESKFERIIAQLEQRSADNRELIQRLGADVQHFQHQLAALAGMPTIIKTNFGLLTTDIKNIKTRLDQLQGMPSAWERPASSARSEVQQTDSPVRQPTSGDPTTPGRIPHSSGLAKVPDKSTRFSASASEPMAASTEQAVAVPSAISAQPPEDLPRAQNRGRLIRRASAAIILVAILGGGGVFGLRAYGGLSGRNAPPTAMPTVVSTEVPSTQTARPTSRPASTATRTPTAASTSAEGSPTAATRPTAASTSAEGSPTAASGSPVAPSDPTSEVGR